MKILIADDDPISRRILEANLLEWGYELMVASDGLEAWEILQKPESPNLIISDWMMPRMDGLELCREIRNMEKSKYIYFIILTAKGEKKDIISGLEAGADDFLTKPFNQEELKYRTRIGERVLNLEHRIMELANIDSLTGLLNRRAFMEKMEQEMSRTQRENNSFSLILTDIDHFKNVNDTYGHQIGDLVLRRFTGQLKTLARPYDFLGRYGGEEFLICLPGANGLQAASTAERMRRQTEDMEIMLPDDSQSIRITASFGTACYSVESEKDVDSLIKRTDVALYMAKNKGRNCVCNSNHSELGKGTTVSFNDPPNEEA
ncbi:MAG: diguanylate cyclase [Proteobacteria bacterium]|nr:diguanylate cyclase [Desulfobacula sp.]MBU3954136.1 diguanylate cyclase [Pseudomonadota bacterium]